MELQHLFDILGENCDKNLAKMHEINNELESILNSKHWLFRSKKWNALIKESNMIKATVDNEIKALTWMENFLKGTE